MCILSVLARCVFVPRGVRHRQCWRNPSGVRALPRSARRAGQRDAAGNNAALLRSLRHDSRFSYVPRIRSRYRVERKRLLWRIMNIQPKPFEGPSALDLLTEFQSQYGAIIDRSGRIARIHDVDVRFFKAELHRVIQSFVAEAIKPYMDALSHAASYQLPRGMMLVDKATLEQLPPIGDAELWRGQYRGVWYRVVIANRYRPELQVSFNASLGEDHEVWQSSGAV